jgi:ADP-dependent NAD(P)H-hydrate dehydratase
MLESPRAEHRGRAGRVERLDAELLRSWPLPVDDDGDKYSRGTVLVIGGSASTPGAALLAGRAALRMGAGRVQIATVPDVVIAIGVALPEALVLPIGAQPDDALRESISAADAIVVGPGMTGDGVAAIVTTVLQHAIRDSVVTLDAAAITIFADLDAGLVDDARSALVMTPNRQEVRSLVADPSDDDVLALAEASGVTGAVLTSFGGVYAPDGRLWQTDTEALGLGTSGSGDVLAGLVGGAAARCGNRSQAACWATFAHHEAGRRLEDRVGVLGYTASDLVFELPACLPR